MNLKNLVDYCNLNNLPSPFSLAYVPEPLNLERVISAIMVRCGLLTPIYGEPDTFREITGEWFFDKQWTFEHLIKIIESEYSPIENVFEERTEKDIYNSDQTRTGGYKDSDSGKDTVSESGTDQRDYAESGTDQRDTSESGTDQRDITNSGTDTTTNTISAFNSSGYQNDNKTEFQNGKKVDDDITYGKKVDDDITYGKKVDDDITYGKKVDDDITYGKKVDDDITYGKQTDTTHGKATERVYNNEKLAHGGIDEHTMNRHGNIGVTTSQQLINEELELLSRFDIYKFIAKLFEEDNMIFVY